MYALILRGGTLVDGTGAPARTADVAIDDGRIVAVGRDLGQARRTLDADGLLVTPGFVDVHTHYDGQATWDEALSPSSGHGVTTVVMGNCGVGFAPVHAEDRTFLIEVMEGVEEIPGAALDAGMTWDWSTFPDYLDALERRPRAIDVATQVPHCALRCFVMRPERALEDHATPDDVAAMAKLTEEALRAGALGFSTSRTLIHRTRAGDPVPGTHCEPEELLGIAAALRAAGHGVFQMISDHMGLEPDLTWMKRIAHLTEGPLLFTLGQLPRRPDAFRHALDELDNAQAEGVDLRAAVPWRPPGVLLGLQATLHPFCRHPSYPRRMTPSDRTNALADPALRDRLLGEAPATANPVLLDLLTGFDQMFELGDPPDYEPPPEASIAARARAAGVDPAAYAYDLLRDPTVWLYRPFGSYVSGDLSAVREMLEHPHTVASLGDGGAHVGSICDAGVTTYMLSHWVRDRHRGPRLPLETVVAKQTSQTADLYGLGDRGRVEVGRRADLNVIDLDTLHLDAPVAKYDLPGGRRRLAQRAHGYRATIVAGEVIMENGEPTGARPGRLVRGPRR
ncbi:MAG: D-aminoacylase [Deltaproteobacteria bacterium]|jgi:N-acyl-D-amino-acid deacylase